MPRTYPIATVTQKGEKMLTGGHVWVYADEIVSIEGNTENGTGEYEGMLTAGREFILQRQDDGYWHCKGFGTGGYTLPE